MTAPVTAAVRRTTVAAVLLVAVVAAVVSYAHVREVAHRAGEAWRSHLLPLSVDGLIVAASMVLLTRRRAGLDGGVLAWCALLGGVGASLAANVAAADPTVTARLVAAWPAVAFAVAFELLLEQRRPITTGPEGEAGEGRGVDEAAVAAAAGPASDGPRPAAVAEVRPPVGAPKPAPACAASAVAAPAAAGGGWAATGRGGTDGLEALAARARELAAANGGRPPGRRVLARQLEVTEHKARTVLDLIDAPATAADRAGLDQRQRTGRGRDTGRGGEW